MDIKNNNKLSSSNNPVSQPPNSSSDFHIDSTFSLRKIPFSNQDSDKNIENDSYIDKIKIIELSNSIYEWEQQILFSENGFFSLKGKNVQDKSKEYIAELEKFIDTKISSISFSLPLSKKAAEKIKQLKIDNIQQKIIYHEAKELLNWESEVLNNAIKLSIDRAVLYKNDTITIKTCFYDGLSILDIMANNEKWNNKVKQSKKDKFKSSFYYAIIMSFFEEKNINFYNYFENYKEYLSLEDYKKLESCKNEMKNNIIAFNWAKELFSYNLSDKENEQEINKLTDDALKKQVINFFEILTKTDKKNEEIKSNQNADKSWNKILSLLQQDPEQAPLFIDFTGNHDIIESQKKYIKQFIKNGFIKTDKSKFIDLFKEMLEDFSSFKQMYLNKYKHLFSENDFIFFQDMQNKSESEYIKLYSDFNFLFKKLKSLNITSKDKIYDFINIFLNEIKEYKEYNDGKYAEIEKRNKIIDSILARNISEKIKEKE